MKKVLILTANPEGTPALRLDKELRDIEDGLRRAQRRDEFSLRQKLAVRPQDIRRELLEYEPQIVHFSGHGTQEEGLVFEDESGQPKLVSGEALAGLFKLFANQIECVVLNGCYSEAQAKEIGKHINYVVGMSQAISDKAAIEFAVGFYDALGAGKSFKLAYQMGCSAIQVAGIKEHSTPVLLNKFDKDKDDNLVQKIQRRLQGRIAWQSTFFTSVLITILITGLRLSGVFQASEFFFFDYMMRSQKPDKQDDRLLIVQITQKDISKYAALESPKNSSSLADNFIYKLLEKLLKHNPRVIGIDNYRYAPAEKELTKLINNKKTNKQLIFICKFPESNEKEGSDPPPDVPEEQVGLSDFLDDHDDVIRRQIIQMGTPVDAKTTESTKCKDKKQELMDSFSFKVAQKYLSKDKKEYRYFGGENGILKSGNTVLQPLDINTQGGYHFRNLHGYQILLNYSFTRDSENEPSLRNIAKTFTVSQVLENHVDKKYVQDKIVLIGTPVTGFDPVLSTPFSTRGANLRIEGLFIQAQMISQLVSAALDERPLLKVWQIEYDMLWILLWSIHGAILYQIYRQPQKLLLSIVISLCILYFICFAIFTSRFKSWIPLVPSAIAFSCSGFVIVFVKLYSQRKSSLQQFS